MAGLLMRFLLSAEPPDERPALPALITVFYVPEWNMPF
jgi:hypothetical protein